MSFRHSDDGASATRHINKNMKKEKIEISVEWFGGHYVANYDASYEDGDGIFHRIAKQINIPSHYNTKAQVIRYLRENFFGKTVKVSF